MSYDLGLYKAGDVEEREPCAVSRHTEGGTYVVGGRHSAELNITYNYAKFYYEHLDAEKGLRWLYDKTGRETAERLFKAVQILGVTRADDYWEPTEGNAGYALSILLLWALEHPEGVWQGD